MQSNPPIVATEKVPVSSPFADSLVDVHERKGLNRSLCIAVIVGVFLAILLCVIIVFGLRYLDDPFRTLSAFPITRYLADYKDLAGSRYRGDLHVEAGLGWKDSAGRLMLFTTQDDPRPIAVLLPPSVANGLDFTKGQIYSMELEVKEGGLVYATLCRKD